MTQSCHSHDHDHVDRFPLRDNSHQSWVFMKNDLERLWRCLQSYYRQHLGLILTQDRVPDLGSIARTGDAENVDKMIVLVLGCAVTCPHRKTHIVSILSTPDLEVTLKSG